MTTISDIISCITEAAPLQLQESYDNSGLLVGDGQTPVDKALITFDITEATVDEAIEKGCKLVISHHPIIFKGLKHIGNGSYIERTVAKAIKNDIALACMHTNLDNSYVGVSRFLADTLGLKHLRILDPMKGKLVKVVTYCPVSHADSVRNAMFEAGAGCIGDYDRCSYNVEGQGSFRAGENTHPYVGQHGETHFESETRIETVCAVYDYPKVVAALKDAHPYEEPAYDIFALENEYAKAGAGMIGELENPMGETEFLELVQAKLGMPCLRHSALLNRKVKTVALCGGSGAFLIGKAKSCKADVYITADIKYHDFFEAEDSILLVDAGHYETEQFSKEAIHMLINKKFPNFALLNSNRGKNPVNYFVKQQNQ